MKTRNNKTLIAFAISSAFFTATAGAAPVDLTGGLYMTYGDANSYSLPINGLEVMAGPGQIDVYTKLGLQSQLSNSTPGMDDAFDTPSANNISGFRTRLSADPGGVDPLNTWDRAGWWDTTLSALNSKIDLVNNSLVFFFANNETGGQDGNPNLAAWGRVELTDSTGTVIARYDLTNHGAAYGAGGVPGTGDPMADVTPYTSTGTEPHESDFVQSGGLVCSDGVTMVDCSAPHTIEYQHNLGGDRAAYAIIFPELNRDIAQLIADGKNLADYAMHVDYRLGCGVETNADGSSFPQVPAGNNKTQCDPNYAINGGSEKVFIGSLQSLAYIPEPTLLSLTALGLLGGALFRRPRKA